jgi:diadenosine tetraphosphate (Ap4A) HIT family hydrolase
VVGGYLFAHSQPRSFLSFSQGRVHLTKKELAGLLASAGIQQLPGIIPSVVFETDKTIAISSPLPEARLDYVIFPKKDIKNIGEITREDSEYLVDAYLVARHIITEKKLSKYRFYTNGPGFQKIAYLHFHLVVD